MKKAFSLIELLISLIIISLITAAFAPIITKRFQKNAIALGGENITYKCSDRFNEDCKLCSKKECLSCQKSPSACLIGQYIDLSKCECVDCNSDSFCKTCDNGLSCKTCPSNRALENGKCTKICEIGFFAPDNNDYTECKNCNIIHQNCTQCTENKCTKCSGNFMAQNGTCIAKEAKCVFDYNGAAYTIPNAVKYTANGRTYCMTSTNIGDGVYANIPYQAGITSISSQSGVCPIGSWGMGPDGNTKCCYKHGFISGTVSTPNPNPEFDYAPQGRTLCNWWAATKVCPYINSPISGKSWHLPSKAELSDLINVINAESSNACTSNIPKSGYIQQCAGKMGLQLCSYYSGYGSPSCSGSHYCISTGGGTSCSPNFLWSSNEYDIEHTYGVSFSGNSLSVTWQNDKNGGGAVRCVLGPFN